jgi:Ser/Thr protein kinase RdoA (MazF antagonist)
MLNDLLDRLNREWLPQPLAAPLHAIKIAGSDGPARKVNFLVFAHQARHPTCLMKICRAQSEETALENEFQRLTYIHALPAMQSSVPQPLGLFAHEGKHVMVETCLPGMSLENLLRRGKRQSPAEIATDLTQVGDWIISLQRATAGATYTFRGEEEVQERLSSLRVDEKSVFLNELRARARASAGTTIPLVARHGDLWPGNVLVADNRMGVIDWETLSLSASPFDDLFFFANLYAQQFSTRAPHLERFTRGFLQKTRVARGIAQLVRRVTLALGLDVDLTPVFFGLFLLDMAGNRSGLGRTGKSDLPWDDFLRAPRRMDELVMTK